jgi:CO/xanthine dehydrogenase Mo-binding subunit
VDTYRVISSGGEGGSNAMSGTGPKIRNVGALARQALLGMASTSLGVPVANLTVDKGVVSGGGKSVKYGDLIGGKIFNLTGANVNLQPGVAPAKPFSAYKTVLKDPNPVVRVEIPDKVTGKYTYVHQVRVPGMLHGRMVRPRGQGAYPYNSNVPASFDPASVSHIPGVQVVHVNNFLGVVAPKEFDAIQAAAQLKVTWSTPPAISDVGNLWKGMRDFDAAGKAPARIAAQQGGDVDAAMKSAAKTYANTFKYHYNMHAPIGPNAALADVTPSGAIIYSHVKDGYGTSRPKWARTNW